MVENLVFKNTNLVQLSGTGQSGDLQRDYYGQLSQAEMRKVYKKYKLDFELYGYDPQSYYDLAFDA